MYSKTMSVEEICRKLRPVFGKKIDNLYLKYSILSDRKTKEEIESALQALYQKHLSESLLNEIVLLEPPKKNIIKGEYPLGTVLYGKNDLYQFGLREKDWIRHVCISGMSGSGKTTFAYQILGNFIFHKKPFLVFDWKKSFRPLMKINKKLMIFTIGNDSIANFKLNINRPPKGVEPKEWISLLADLITESYNASFGVHKLLVQVLDKAFKDFGIYSGSDNYPTWYQIRDRLEDKAQSKTRKSRESEWLESALRIAYALTFGNFGAAICYKGSNENSISELLEKQCIMELASLANIEKKFFCQFILAYINKYAKAGNVNVTEDFKSAILVDEAHNIFLKEKPSFITESIPDIIFREIREYGIGLITLDQHISKLSDVVSGNSATNIAFQQILPYDIENISRLMQLHQNKEYFSKLPVGVAIVKLAERHHEPFCIKAPLMKLKSLKITDEEIKSQMKSLITDKKRLDLFNKQCEEKEIVNKLSKLKGIFIQSNVKPNEKELRTHLGNKNYESTIKDVARAQEEYNKKEKDGPKGFGLRNHLEQEIFDQTKKRMLNGESFDIIRRWFIKEGYSASDVNHTFNYIKRKGYIERWSGQKDNFKEIILSVEQKNFLKIILENPKKNITSLYKIAKLSPRKGNELKKFLELEGVIITEENKTKTGWNKSFKIIRTDLL